MVALGTARTLGSFALVGACIAASDRTAASLWLVDANEQQVDRCISLSGRPTGVVWAADGQRVYVSECDAATVAAVDPISGEVQERFAVERHPEGLALANGRKLLLVANSTTHNVSLVDLVVKLQRKTSAAEVNEALRSAAAGPLAGLVVALPSSQSPELET